MQVFYRAFFKRIESMQVRTFVVASVNMGTPRCSAAVREGNFSVIYVSRSIDCYSYFGARPGRSGLSSWCLGKLILRSATWI